MLDPRKIATLGIGFGALAVASLGFETEEIQSILTGDGWMDQAASELSGSATTGAIAHEIAPDGFPGGVPSTGFLADAKIRQGLVLRGDGVVDQPVCEAIGNGAYKSAKAFGHGAIEQAPSALSGKGRVRRAVLVATCCEIETGCGYCDDASAEFVDTELEAFALAAAIGANELLRAA